MDDNYFSEGKVKIYKNYNNGVQEVFYNKVQVFNRDVSLIALLVFANNYYKKYNKGINFLDALTATGLRALRIRKELPEELVNEVVGTDLSKMAIEHFDKNIELNELSNKKIKANHKDCIIAMIEREKDIKFNAIDLDPYGSSVQFLDPAIRYIENNGIICATCTDSRVFEGSDLHRCYYLYGASRAKTSLIKENGLRIFIGTINRIANTMNKSIKVLLSVHGGFYIRVFFQVINKKLECGKSLEKTGITFFCHVCGNYEIHKFGSKKEKGDNCYKINFLNEFNTKCKFCENLMQVNGPIWLDQLNDKEFVTDMEKNINLIEEKKLDYKIDSLKKIKGILNCILLEKNILGKEHPYGFNVERLTKFAKSNQINKLQLFSIFMNSNYKIAHSYLNSQVFKTDAPYSFIINLIKKWVF